MKKLILLVLPLLFIYIMLVKSTPLQFDELLFINIVTTVDWLHLFKYLIDTEIQMPLQYLLVKFLYLFNDSVWFLRLPTLILSSFLPVVIYLYGRIDHDQKTSLLAALMTGLSLPVLIYSMSVRPYALLLFSFYTTLFLLRMNFQSSYKNVLFLISSTLLFLSHPVGSALSFVLDFISLIQKRTPALYLSFLAKLGLIISLMVIRRDLLGSIIIDSFNSKGPLLFLQKVSFLFSGLPFAGVILMLALITFARTRRLPWINRDSLENKLILLPLFIGIILSFWLEGYLHARYFIFCTPIIFFLVLEQMQLLPKKTQSLFIILAISSLLLKAFAIDRLHAIPYEIDSEKMARKLEELAQEEMVIVNCGNCLSYYIKGENLQCMGPYYDYTQIQDIKGPFLYLELDFVKEACGIQLIDKRILKLKQWPYQGGTIYLLDRSPLQYTPHLDLPTRDHKDSVL